MRHTDESFYPSTVKKNPNYPEIIPSTDIGDKALGIHQRKYLAKSSNHRSGLSK